MTQGIAALPAGHRGAEPRAGPSFFDNNSSVQVGAYADSEATSYFATEAASRPLRPEAFRVPDKAIFGSDAGRLRGADANLALADPSYASALSLLTGRPAMSRVVNGLSNSSSGGVWFLTDLATARSPRASPRSSCRTPTVTSWRRRPSRMAAAVPTMKADADGMLIPDPQAAAPRRPAAALSADLRRVRAGAGAPARRCHATSAAPIRRPCWPVGSPTSPPTGQTILPAGYQPLTADLKAQAAAAIPTVGATPAATPCTTDRHHADHDERRSRPTAPAGSPSGGSAVAVGRHRRSTGSSGSDPTATPTAPTSDKTELAAPRSRSPTTAAARWPAAWRAAGAIFGIIILTALAAKATGRPPTADAPSAVRARS